MKLSPLLFLLPLLTSVTFGAPAVNPDQVLFNFAGKFELGKVEATEAVPALVKAGRGQALSVATRHEQPWPGVTLRAPGGHWDLTAFSEIQLQVKDAGTNPVTVYCRVDNPGADGKQHCVTASIKLAPGKSGTLKVPLRRTSGGQLNKQLFGLRGYPAVAGGPETVDPGNITQLVIFVSKPTADFIFEVSDIRATGTWTRPTAWVEDAQPFFPFIDTMGQYRHRDWPGKTRAVADLAVQRDQEIRALANDTGPKDWDKFGGSRRRPQLRATGFFRTQKVHGKWWLVDPEGHRFFSHGIDCVGSLDTTPIEERESWFADSPARQPEFAGFLGQAATLKGHYAGKQPLCFSFAGANLVRKYGPDWRASRAKLIHQRLRSWGINTVGNWSDEQVCRMRLTPYTDSIGSWGSRMIEGSRGYWGKFPDIFDPSFADSLRRSMESKRGGSAGDPWCIGYFSDNEMSWGDELSLAVATLKSGADQAAKKALMADLQTQYSSIGKLNEAWGTSHASWDDFLQERQPPEMAKARADLGRFYTRAAEQYFRLVREAIRAVAPSQLYLGCRFAGVNARAAAAAAKYCDVVSYNIYQASVLDFPFNSDADVPLIIGEFHFGALDRGLFHTGLVPVANQAARAQAYRNYVRDALHHPRIVGCHWFQYQDEPTTGRVYDEENYQIGFVDIADTPYAELIEASRDIGYHMYR